MAKIIFDSLFNKPKDTVPNQYPQIEKMTQAQLLEAPSKSVWRISHSTLLFKLGDEFIITDPVFAERASPFQWIGPKRFHSLPITIAELPTIKAVVLSHNHYDHLDKQAVAELAVKTQLFLVPKGLHATIVEWTAHKVAVVELDWWESHRFGDLTFTSTPAQHFSGRGLHDADATLWCSWVIEHHDTRLFFSGDSGYFDGFNAIGEHFGDFDLACIECGAYDENWSFVHMFPEQTLQAFIDLKAKCLMPIHNGSFDLAMHRWNDPLTRIHRLIEDSNTNAVMPRMGERTVIGERKTINPWWEIE